MQGITIDWSKLDWKWIFTTVVALYGAGLSTYREMMARLEKRARVNVTMSTSIALMGPGRTVDCIKIDVGNHGHTDVIFDSKQFVIQIKGWEKSLIALECLSSAQQFPVTVKPGASLWFLSEREYLMKGLRESNRGTQLTIRATVFDAISRGHHSKWQTIELTQ